MQQPMQNSTSYMGNENHQRFIFFYIHLLKHIPHQANRTCQLSLSNGNMVESTKVRTEAYKDAYISHSIGAWDQFSEEIKSLQFLTH